MRPLAWLCACLCSFTLYAKPMELVFWHAMAGHLGEQVNQLAQDFNISQHDYVIKPVYKGNYIETLTSFAASFRAHHPPAIVQIFEVGSAFMRSPQGIIKPTDELMQEQGLSLPKDDFIQSVREFYSLDGVLMAMPFNLSVPILYYNLDLLKKVGYTPDNFPQTWEHMEALAKKIKQAGYKCTYASAYPGWILFESYLAIHGLPLIKNKHVAYNTAHMERHFKRLKRWNRLGYLRYGGRDDDATIFFTSGVCPLFSQSSGAYNSLAAMVPFKLGVAVMPLDMQVSQVRHANTAGGAALWAVAGQSNAQYRGIAQFFAFIAKPETQLRWHEQTGYLPLGLKGRYAGILQSSKHPTLRLAQTDLEEQTDFIAHKNPGPQNQIRQINDEVLEALFAGLISSDNALQESVDRANQVLLRFARNTE